MRRTLTVLIAFSLFAACAIALSFVLTGMARAADEMPAAPAPAAPPAPVEPPAAAEPAPEPGATETATEEELQQDVDGTIKELNATARTMTVTYLEINENDQEVEKTVALKIDEKAKVSIDSEDKELKDIRLGDRALVSFTKAEKGPSNVTEIAVTRLKDEEGTFKSVDTKAKQIVITVTTDEDGKEVKKDAAFTLPDEVPVMIDGEDKTLKDILPGDETGIAYLEDTPGQKIVKAIDITRTFSLGGKVKTLDINGKKLVVTVITEDNEGKEATKDETLNFGPEVGVIINGEEKKLEDVKVGDEVWATYTKAPGGPMALTQIDVDRTPPNP